MEIHKPKPAHSVREFLIELLTIVAGILIAISLEQAVESLHWHEKVASARSRSERSSGMPRISTPSGWRQTSASPND